MIESLIDEIELVIPKRIIAPVREFLFKAAYHVKMNANSGFGLPFCTSFSE